jgi:hypothetical protein
MASQKEASSVDDDESMEIDEEQEALNSLVSLTEYVQERNYSKMAKFFNDLMAAYAVKLNSKGNNTVQLVPDQVEPAYTGVHINTEKYEEADFYRMLDAFKSSQMIHAKYALKIVQDAIEKLENFSNISHCNLKKSQTSLPAVLIVGDLHGSMRDLIYIVDKYGVPGKKYRFVFNGDYVGMVFFKISNEFIALY